MHACAHTHTQIIKKKNNFLKVFTDVFMGFPDGSVVKNLPIKQEMWFCPWAGKISWRRINPIQFFSCLGNPMDRGA